jgi:hypothetical protein
MSRKVYIAARLAIAEDAASFAHRLRKAGHRVVSRWHDMMQDHLADKHRATRQAICMRNWMDVGDADTLIAFAHKDCRGTLAEITKAFFDGKRIVVIGKPFELTLMLDLPGIHWVNSTDDAVAMLERM